MDDMAKWTWRGPDDDDAAEAEGLVEVDESPRQRMVSGTQL